MKLVIRILVVVVLIVLIFEGYNLLQKKITQTTNYLKTVTGQIVPSKWIDKAKNLGYYCPSWDAKPGQIVSDICYKLAK